MDRWKRSNNQIPEIDRKDIRNENPFMNKDSSLTLNIDSKRQHHPEFTQTSYLRMRSLEEAFAINNYLDPKYSLK